LKEKIVQYSITKEMCTVEFPFFCPTSVYCQEHCYKYESPHTIFSILLNFSFLGASILLNIPLSKTLKMYLQVGKEINVHT
jgi:hypothetical protein